MGGKSSGRSARVSSSTTARPSLSLARTTARFPLSDPSAGPGVALDAFELRDGSAAGYQFQIIGNPEEDLLGLLGRLIEEMRRACPAHRGR